MNLLDLARPIAVALVRFTLVENDSLDDAVFLGFLCHINQTLVRVTTIVLDNILEPASLVIQIALIHRGIERHNAATRNGHDNDTDSDLRVKLFDQGASEVIGGASRLSPSTTTRQR